MSIKKFSMMLISAVSLFALLNGCGASSKESGITAVDVARVGDTACFQCHSGSADPLTGETFVSQYQRSLHANLGCESCHGGGAQHNGIGPFPYVLNGKLSDAQKAQRCAMCHNGTDAPLSSSANFQNGNHANPFSAEEAHEAKCARCHSHEGAILYGKDGFTGDKSIIDNTAYQPVLARDPETFSTIKCATCHEHGGNIRQTKTRDLAGNVVTWDPNSNKVTDQFDLCTSCHTMNTNEGTLIGSGNVLNITNTAGGVTPVTTAAYYHNTRWFRTLPSTHVDQAASGTSATGTVIEGYVIRKNTKNPCFDCHGHEFQTNTRKLDPAASDTVKARPNTVFLDWAQSAHAGKLMTQKIAAATGLSGTAQVDAVMKAGVNKTSGPGWAYYNWDNSTGNPSTHADPDRKSCQRCHTSTGAANFMTNPATYDAANNSFTHLAGWTSTNKTSPQNELLNCWGCHSNAGNGTLRNPGAITETYGAATTGDPATTVAYPDVAGSNVCMSCHLGRETGDVIKNDQDADGVRGFVNSHYLSAGGQLFGKSGYQFTGLSYANPSYFAHDKIGTAAQPGTGTNGPCVGCHMTTSNGHQFTNVTKNATTGAITALTSSACIKCHDGTNGPALAAGNDATVINFLNEEEHGYKAALEELRLSLNAKGVFWANSNPYFFKDTNGNGIIDPGVENVRANAFTNWASVYGLALWKDTMGAAFNLNLLIHDPGGYAHNRIYSKRLIYDAIDFIEDGAMNGSIARTMTATAAAYLDASTTTAGVQRP